MHEATQRRLVRAAFLLCCIAPTLGVVGWAIAWSLPSHASQVELQLSRLTGLAIRVDQVAHPTPKVMRLNGLQIIDPESRQRLARVDTLALIRTGKVGKIWANQAFIDADARLRLWYLVRSRLVEHDVLLNQSWRYVIRSIEVADGSRRHALRNVRGEIETKGVITKIDTTTSVGSSEGAALQIAIERDRSRIPLQTLLTFQTHEQQVPIGLLSTTARQRLGHDCTFSGTVQTTWTSHDWMAEVTGQVDEIACENLLRKPLLEGVEGRGTIILQPARIGSGGIQNVHAQLRIHDGTVSLPLVHSLVAHYLCDLDPSVKLTGDISERLTFHEFGVDVRMDDRGLTMIKGLCHVDGSSLPAALVGPQGPLLWCAAFVNRPAYLARSIVPADAADAAQIASRIQRFLPRYMPTRVPPREQ